MPDQRTKALLISVSENAEQVISAIHELKPECLCFFAAEESRAMINNDIIPKLKERPPWMAEIVTGDANDLLVCYKAITGKWEELQKNWRLEPGDWTVDYTGGTKPMVAALVLATVEDSSGYRYTGRQINPWDELAIRERHEAAILFGRGRYSQVAEIFSHVARRVSGGEKHLYKALADVAEGYGLWDNFQHKQAWEKLKPAQKSLEMATVFGGPPGLKAFTAKLKESLAFLEKLAMGMPGIRQEHFLDLMANARRRAGLEHRYDDAQAHLCRALETYGQIRLASRGINTSDVQPEQIPQEVRSEFAGRYWDPVDDRIRLPLYGSYKVLELFKDPAGLAFFELWPQIKLLLDSRNKTILSYGLEPVKRERFEEMLKLVCRISGVPEGAIPGFPDIIL
ncbi:MAG: TIGR02710 family CRISPR-associated protein [Nitrospirae bacterium]|nr:TIGR02710 family CRISPR-associated protein [Nitrospirota bacterium]